MIWIRIMNRIRGHMSIFRSFCDRKEVASCGTRDKHCLCRGDMVEIQSLTRSRIVKDSTLGQIYIHSYKVSFELQAACKQEVTLIS